MDDSTERFVEPTIRPIIKRHGGKKYLCRRLLRLFPAHGGYTEAYGGGLSLLLNKPRAAREVIFDRDPDLINLYRSLQADGDELARLLRQTEYCEDVFLTALRSTPLDEMPDTPDLFAAYWFVVRCRFSRGGMGRDFAWSERLRGGRPGDLNAWCTFVDDDLPRIVERLRGVVVATWPEYETGAEVIERHDGPEVIHYTDPTYLQSTRSAKKVYRYEMTDDDHQRLLETLLRCRGKVFLSSYRNPMYDEMLAGWRRHEFELPNHSGQGPTKQRRIECLYESP